ncbi:hypothetical protein DITRI_Ditri06bG0158200 [Diplodiscus trichospermus]
MSKLIGTATNIAYETATFIFQEAKHRVRYVINYMKKVEKFEEKMKSLIAKREIDEESKKVKELKGKAKAKCFLGLCPNIKSRYQLSKKVEEDVTAVDDLQ